MITHVEMVMAEVMEARTSSSEEWLAHLPPRRREGVERERRILARKRLDPPPIELTKFQDKSLIVISLLGLDDLGHAKLARIGDLRNKLAHLGNYAENEARLQDFVGCLALSEKWIERIRHGETPVGEDRIERNEGQAP